MTEEKKKKKDSGLGENNIYITDDIINPNETILETFNELNLVNTVLKDTRAEIREKFNEEDDILQLTHEISEFKAKMKPKEDILKTKKEEFRAKNTNLFLQEDELKKKKEKLLKRITVAVMKKQELNDDSPIVINDGKKPKRLIIQLNPKMKKV